MTSDSRTRAMQVLAVAGLVLLGCFAVLPGAGASSATSLAPQASTCDSAYGCNPNPTPGGSPTCSVDPTSARAGGTVKATVAGAPASSEVSVSFDGTVAKTGTTDGNGAATISFTVPSSATAGKHTISVFGASFQCDATAGNGFTVLAGSLSRTGSDVVKYVAAALILLVAGLQLLFFARWRRNHAVRGLRVAA